MSQKQPKIETTNKYKTLYETLEKFLELQEDDVTLHPGVTLEEFVKYLNDYVEEHGKAAEEDEQ